MADGGALREILISLGVEVETGELKKSADEIQGLFGKIKGKLKGLAEAFAIEKFREFIGGQIEAGAQLKVTAERLGTTTDELQAMRLAAGEAGVGVESMDTALRFLNRNVGEAAKGSGEQAASFQKLGISLKDSSGAIRPTGDLLADLADKVAKAGTSAEKTQITMGLLGRGGSQLIPLLNRGGQAFKDATKDVEELCGGLSGDFVEAAHKAEEQNVRLEFAMSGLKSNIANSFLPTWVAITQGLAGFVKTAIDVEKKSHIVEDALSFLKAGAIVGGILRIVSALRAMTQAQLVAFLTNPITLWIVGIGLALLAFNDLKVALAGGKSVFGDLFGQTGIDKLRIGMSIAASLADAFWVSVQSLGDEFMQMGHWAEYAFDKVLEGAARAGAFMSRLSNGIARLTGSKEQSPEDAAQEQANIAQYAGRAPAAAAAAGQDKSRENQRLRDLATRVVDRDDAVRGVGTNQGATGYVSAPTPQSAYARINAPSIPGGLARGAPSGAATGGTGITQHNTFHTTVHTSADTNEGTGKAVNNGVSSAVQRANDKALVAFELP